jgi:hypothetical protein
MRFMTIVKSAENAGPPPQALMDAIAKLGEEAARAGTLVEMGGLFPTAMGARVRLSKGQLTVTDGPFTEAKSRDEAIEAAVHFMELHKKHWPGWEGETEVRQIFEAPVAAR